MTIGIGIGSVVTGRSVSRTGRSAIFPSVGLTLVALILAGIAFVSPHLTAGQTSWAFGLVSIFMGTVMGVVQLTVQLAGGPRQLGSAAASVQFSRSLGAALGTALVGSILLLTIAASHPAAGEAFAAILQEGPEALQSVSADERAIIEAGLHSAFRNAFLCASALSMIAAATAWSLPVRRV